MATDEGDDEGEGTASYLGVGDGLGSTDLEGSPSADPHSKSPPRHLVTGTLESENPTVSQPLLGNSYPGEVPTPRLHKSVVEKSL